MLTDVKKRYSVFSVKESKSGHIWTRAGAAFVNRDGSLNVVLDVLPLDGRLHVRESMDFRDRRNDQPQAAASQPQNAPVPMQVQQQEQQLEQQHAADMESSAISDAELSMGGH